MTAILGISAFYHDSAAALVVDGNIVAAAQEERFTRKKHDYNFPKQAIDYCLKEAGLKSAELDYVTFYDKPFLKFERLLETYLAYSPRGLQSFFKAMPLWLRQKLHLRREMNRGLDHQYRKRYVFTEHHESHAASAFFPSPFEEAAVLTLDGVGEWATASFGYGRGNKIELTHELHFPHSLGLLYSAFTYFTGFRVNSGEYKLMGLAPYGEPTYADLMLEKLLDLKEDGSFRMDMSYFNYCQGLTMTSRKMDGLFGGPPRTPETPLTQREMDIAASIQQVTEEIMLRAARHVHEETGMQNLCLAGGVALNCVGNGRILRDGPFDNIWIQPAAGDAGGALGAALFVWYQLLDNSISREQLDNQKGSLLGPEFTDQEIRTYLDSISAKYHSFEDDESLCDFVSRLMAEEKVIGWLQGRMEFGPRALGSRSILGDARSRQMQSVMNLKIKFRESFRPFAPSVLQESVDDFFEMRPREESPYMLLVAPVQESKRLAVNGEDVQRRGIDKLKVIRSEVPAITHVDNSARVQTVDPKRNGRYYKLIKKFEEKTGCPVVINTSFNIRGEPIVCSPEQAYRCFMATNMDVLVLERNVLIKSEQPNAEEIEIDEYLAQFELDESARPVATRVLLPLRTSKEYPRGKQREVSIMGLLEVKKDFTRRELMLFGPLFGLFVGLVCYLFLWDNVRPAITYVVAGITACLILLYYLIPPLRLPVYRGWLYSVMPIGWVISHVLLTAIYYLLMTPVGMLMRLCRYDPMNRKFEREAKTYWIRREQGKDPRQYFRQF